MLNEFRQDLVSGEWVLFATGRTKRPHLDAEEAVVLQSKDSCPFEDPEKSGNEVIDTYYNTDHSDWTIKVAKNKYPAVAPGVAGEVKQEGLFNVIEGRGEHEVVILRSHEHDLADFNTSEMAELLKVYQDRYVAILNERTAKYILIFHNRGVKAGASLQHPHSQIISTPILPPDIRRSIDGSSEFYKKNKKKVYDAMIDWEMQEDKRIVYQNEQFVAFCPFVSKMPYEVRIFAKEGHAHFEKMPAELLVPLGDIMSDVLSKFKKALRDPDFNFFIHTAPLDGDQETIHNFYTWHIEILPKLTKMGGFDIGSGIDINEIDPDEAAKLLRGS